MKWIKVCFAGLAVVLIAAGGVYLWLPYFNDYQENGQLSVPGLREPVTVKRDQKQMAYVHAQILPVNINPDVPDDTGGVPFRLPQGTAPNTRGAIHELALQAGSMEMRLDLGSNNWVVSPVLSGGRGAILAGDPHLDPRILPGVWYPVGLITPELRAVDVTIPGLPGMAMGRTQHVSLAMTNNYGDMQYLYVESVDPANPDHYMEGGDSIPFDIITETLRIRDKDTEGGFRQEDLVFLAGTAAENAAFRPILVV